MQARDSGLTIGALAQRAGVATSAVRFYEAQGLLRCSRTEGNQRRYAKETLRRVAFIRIAQGVGLSLDDIRAALATLPDKKRKALDKPWAAIALGVYAFRELQAKVALTGLATDPKLSAEKLPWSGGRMTEPKEYPAAPGVELLGLVRRDIRPSVRFAISKNGNGAIASVHDGDMNQCGGLCLGRRRG